MKEHRSNGKELTATGSSEAVSYGPLANLEEYVPSDWWRRIFNGLYLKTDADVVMDEHLTRSEIDLVVDVLNLRPTERILDLCCGQGRHTLELAGRGFMAIEGLDRSHTLIQRARRSANALGLPIRFREGDARRLPLPAECRDVVLLLGNSFGYFESVDDDLRILAEIQRVLAPSGRILIDVADGDHIRSTFETRSWEWIDQKTYVCRERSLSKDSQRLISREIITDTGRGVLADQFYAERLYSRTDLFSLLAQAGFVDPILHTELQTTSKRNQDLGMMARRLLISARVDKEKPGEIVVALPALSEVVVVMGDPTIDDRVKPDGRFDEDDFETIRRLRAALAGIDGMNFTYLQEHATLQADLEQLADSVDLVFNLCDEGFQNRARWELHVPAALEMLGLPYTGAGPQCLAICYDKSLVRGAAQEMGIAVPAAVFLTRQQSTVNLPFSFPVIVKPNSGDSSMGITTRSVAWDADGVLSAIAEIRDRFGHQSPVLVEEFLEGKDLSVGIIGNPPEDYRVLPIIEEDYTSLPAGLPRICGYEAKWMPGSPYSILRSIPADLPEATLSALRADSLRLFERLECRDYARFDWRLDVEGTPRLLEVNPNPGWCWDGHLAKMAALDGMSYWEMLAAILQAARLRIGPARPRQPLAA